MKKSETLEKKQLVEQARKAFEEAKVRGTIPSKEFMDKCASEIGVETSDVGKPPIPPKDEGNILSP